MFAIYRVTNGESGIEWDLFTYVVASSEAKAIELARDNWDSNRFLKVPLENYKAELVWYDDMCEHVLGWEE